MFSKPWTKRSGKRSDNPELGTIIAALETPPAPAGHRESPSSVYPIARELRDLEDSIRDDIPRLARLLDRAASALESYERLRAAVREISARSTSDDPRLLSHLRDLDP